MAEYLILNKLVEVVQNVAENRSGASPGPSTRAQNASLKIEDTIKQMDKLFIHCIVG